MIVYFSGTGNSAYVAKRLQRELQEYSHSKNVFHEHYQVDSIPILRAPYYFLLYQLVQKQ